MYGTLEWRGGEIVIRGVAKVGLPATQFSGKFDFPEKGRKVGEGRGLQAPTLASNFIAPGIFSGFCFAEVVEAV